MKRRANRGVRHRSYDSTGWWTRGNTAHDIAARAQEFDLPEPPELPPVEEVIAADAAERK